MNFALRLSLLVSMIFFNLSTLAATDPLPATMQEPLMDQIYRLVDQRNPASAIFKQALSSQNSEIQKSALIGLARIGGPQILPLVKPFLNHKTAELRQLAALALGISGFKESTVYLWKALQAEKEDIVKKEIYLALGNLGQDHLITKMMQQLSTENSRAARSVLFQGLSIALTFHRDLKDDYSQLDYKKLLSLFSIGDDKAATVGLFLSRIPNIETYINAGQLLPLTKIEMSLLSQSFLARLINKVSVNKHKANREILAWVIQQSESTDLNLQIEAIRILKNFINTPQALMQLGKLHIAAEPIVAQTALKTITDSDLATPEVIALLKKQLKNTNPALVVEAMAGLVKRQEKDDMTWVLQFFAHQNTYVKISLIGLLENKYKSKVTDKTQQQPENFDNVIKMFANSPDKRTRDYANKILEKSKLQQAVKEPAASTPSYAAAKTASTKQLLLKTTIGDIKFQLNKNAPYTAWQFINNVNKGYFNGSYFNRVIGGFVAQGGDNIGNGEGSSGETIREEINFLAHAPMSVGVATSGKDTGSSQFFINTGRNFHLDRNYTVFAHVIEGQAVVYRLTHGVIVESIEVLEP